MDSAEAMSLIWKVFNRSIFVRDPAWDMVGVSPTPKVLEVYGIPVTWRKAVRGHR